MKFECKEISISDEEFGCTVSLCEKENIGASETEMTIDEVVDSIGQYVLLQRTYPEDEFESDYYYIESNISGKSGELKDFCIDLYRTLFLMTYNNGSFEIAINPSEQEFENLKIALEKLTNNRGQLKIHE